MSGLTKWILSLIQVTTVTELHGNSETISGFGTIVISWAKMCKKSQFGKTQEDEALVRQWIEYAVCYGNYVGLAQTARQVLKVWCDTASWSMALRNDRYQVLMEISSWANTWVFNIVGQLCWSIIIYFSHICMHIYDVIHYQSCYKICVRLTESNIDMFFVCPLCLYIQLDSVVILAIYCLSSCVLVISSVIFVRCSHFAIGPLIFCLIMLLQQWPRKYHMCSFCYFYFSSRHNSSFSSKT